MFPLMEIPFDAYSKLLDSHKKYLVPFIPSKMEDDLMTGTYNTMVYWYPRYVLKLYDLAYEGLDFKIYLDALNTKNYFIFVELFSDTTKKLEKLAKKNVKLNHLGEIKI